MPCGNRFGTGLRHRVSQPTAALKLVTTAYRRGLLPPRGFGKLFNRLPVGLWGGPVVDVDTDAGPMTLPIRDNGVRQLLVFGRLRHEEAETVFMGDLAPRLRHVIDIGANVGWYSCILGSHGFPAHGKIIAVEPNPAIFPYLRANAQRHPAVKVVGEAVGDQPGELTFYAAESSDLSSSIRQVGEPVTVPATTVDALAGQHFEGPVDLVKCDVEGGEMAVLRGARDLRNSDTPPIWMLEADERFLVETGSSYEALEDEVNSAREPVQTFFVGPDGRWEVLPHFAALRGTTRVNVVIVPACREPMVAGLLPV